MVITNDELQKQLEEKFGADILTFVKPSDRLSCIAPKSYNLKILQLLFDHYNFKFLNDLTAVHYPDNIGGELAVVYHISNLQDKVYFRLTVFTSIGEPDVFTATQLFSAANWMERETYDFFGVQFIGHPNLKRILNVEEMTYYPMRKEYPLEDQTRKDKDDQMFGR
ncbi:MAG: NADH-quinone oxidoreductase subunit C [Phycisphaerales bacterium]|nr:NADH-quinone oxidoreductase subunit C [Phycisphaerales bacterium]